MFSIFTSHLDFGTSVAMEHNGLAMCSSGFETQNFKYRTNYDSRTNVKERTNTAIAYSRC